MTDMAEYFGSPPADGTEAIVCVNVTTVNSQGIKKITPVKGCIINYEELKIKCNELYATCTCYSKYKRVLLLPLKVEKEDEVEAKFYKFEKRKTKTLKLESQNKLMVPDKMRNQFVCLSVGNNKVSVKSKNNRLFQQSIPVKSKSYFLKYSKSIKFVKQDELVSKQGESLFGIQKDGHDATERAKYVELTLSDDGKVRVKCKANDQLHPIGTLLYGKYEKLQSDRRSEFYNVKVIGSYSVDKQGGITYELLSADEETATREAQGNTDGTNGEVDPKKVDTSDCPLSNGKPSDDEIRPPDNENIQEDEKPEDKVNLLGNINKVEDLPNCMDTDKEGNAQGKSKLNGKKKVKIESEPVQAGASGVAVTVKAQVNIDSTKGEVHPNDVSSTNLAHTIYKKDGISYSIPPDVKVQDLKDKRKKMSGGFNSDKKEVECIIKNPLNLLENLKLNLTREQEEEKPATGNEASIKYLNEKTQELVNLHPGHAQFQQDDEIPKLEVEETVADNQGGHIKQRRRRLKHTFGLNYSEENQMDKQKIVEFLKEAKEIVTGELKEEDLPVVKDVLEEMNKLLQLLSAILERSHAQGQQRVQQHFAKLTAIRKACEDRAYCLAHISEWPLPNLNDNKSFAATINKLFNETIEEINLW